MFRNINPYFKTYLLNSAAPPSHMINNLNFLLNRIIHFWENIVDIPVTVLRCPKKTDRETDNRSFKYCKLVVNVLISYGLIFFK